MLITGIDIGTTGCKCTIYRSSGELLSESYREYQVEENTNEHQINPLTVWKNILVVLEEASDKVDRIDAIGVSSFGETFVLLDEKDQPLMDSLLYTDPRGGKQCKKLIEEFGADYLNHSTGLNPNPMYSISKLMWIKENKTEIYKKTKYICLFQDFIVYKLSGVRQLDYSMATRTMAFDINNLEWNENIFNFAGIDKNKMSKLVPTGSKAGFIKKDLAEKLGINNDAEIVSCCHDQIAAAVGAGVNKNGMAVDGIGTVECITPVFDKNIDKSVLYDGSYAIVPFLDNNFVTYAFSFTGGALLKWYRDKLAYLETEAVKKEGRDPYTYFNNKIDISRPSSLLLLPHFSGAATPYMDNDAKGAIVGLTTETTRYEIYQAIMEGISFEMLLNIEELERAGIEIEELRATGGGARSREWLQMKADIYNKKIVSLGSAQAGTLGSIMLAGVVCGIYENLEEANNIFLKTIDIYEPDPETHEKYQQNYRKYKKMYQAIKEILN